MFTAKQKTKVHQEHYEATVVSFQVFSSVSYVTFIMCLCESTKRNVQRAFLKEFELRGKNYSNLELRKLQTKKLFTNSFVEHLFFLNYRMRLSNKPKIGVSLVSFFQKCMFLAHPTKTNFKVLRQRNLRKHLRRRSFSPTCLAKWQARAGELIIS